MRVLRRIGGGCLGLLWLVVLSRTEAEPILYQATGTREQIQTVIDQFKHDIINGIGSSEQESPQNLGSYKLATMDDILPLPAMRGPAFSSGGLSLQVDDWRTATLLLSGGTETTNGSSLLFGEINALYPVIFQAFQWRRLSRLERRLVRSPLSRRRVLRFRRVRSQSGPRPA